MGMGRVALIGAVHESLDAFWALADHPSAELVCVATLSESAAREVSGVVDLAGPAAERGVPVLAVDDVNAPESVARLRSYAPDLIVVVGWTRLIKDELLALPPRGCIGFHASLLPRHRGRAPVNWAILRGETETGNTLMLLDAGVDTGRVVDQRATPIYADDTCGTVYARVARLGADMLVDNLGPLLTGAVAPRPQDESRADVLGKRVPAMGVTDWTRPPMAVHNWIRAQTHPYPGAFTSLDGERLMLWASEVPLGNDHRGEPGTVLEVAPSGVRVAAGSGSLVLSRVGPAEGEELPAATWAAQTGLRVGQRFEQPSAELAAWAHGEGPRPAAVAS